MHAETIIDYLYIRRDHLQALYEAVVDADEEGLASYAEPVQAARLILKMPRQSPWRNTPIFECTGCGTVTRDPSKHTKLLQRAGHFSCCPERSMVLLSKLVPLRSEQAQHLPLPIGKEHFDRWLQLFNQTIDELFEGQIAENARKRAASIARIMLAVKENQ